VDTAVLKRTGFPQICLRFTEPSSSRLLWANTSSISSLPETCAGRSPSKARRKYAQPMNR
jgi:hypothetical protein